LRWRRMTEPQPNSFQRELPKFVEEITGQTRRLRHFVGDESLLDQLASATTAVAEMDSPLGTILLESITEVGVQRGVVVATSGPARSGLQSWLDQHGVTVLVPSE